MATKPAVFGFRAERYIFVPFASCLQILVTNVVFRLRWAATNRTDDCCRVRRSRRPLLFGRLKTHLIFLPLKYRINNLVAPTVFYAPPLDNRVASESLFSSAGTVYS